jgi:hypothetical protein
MTFALPVDAALGRVDYVEVMGYSDHLITSAIWYRLLNCGFRIPAGAGTDAFPNFASLRGPAGLVRTFADTHGRADQASFLAALNQGRTFVTNAPLLSLTVEGRAPGDELRLPVGPHSLKARVWMRSPVPLDHVEIIRNGTVAATVPLSADRRSSDATVEIPIDATAWLVLRAYADRPRLPVLDLYPFASTSPVYVQAGDAPVRSPEDAAFFLAWLDRVAEATAASTSWNTPAERAHALAQIAQARAEYVNRSHP